MGGYLGFMWGLYGLCRVYMVYTGLYGSFRVWGSGLRIQFGFGVKDLGFSSGFRIYSFKVTASVLWLLSV